MFGVSAKERLAQLQQKGAKDAEVGKPSSQLKPTSGKFNGAPAQLKKPEPPKPAADLKKAPGAPQPAKPKEEFKASAVPEPAKPQEEPKAPAISQPVKPKDEPKAHVAPQPAKPKEEPKAPAALQPAKPKEEPKAPAAPQPAKPKEEPKASVAPQPAKPKEEPSALAAPQSSKPKEEHKTPAAPQPAKPIEEPKAPAAPQPAKPKEEPKAPAAPQPAKPKEEPKAPVAPQPAKPKEEPKAPVVTVPANPKEEPKKQSVPEPPKQREEPKTLAIPEPGKPKEEYRKPVAPEPHRPANLSTVDSIKPAAQPAAAKPVEEIRKSSDDFSRGIFYFSGMGTLVGSALAEGVYVPEKTQRNALDSDEIESAREKQRLRRGEEIIVTARNQAQGLSTDFRHLQALLDSLPTFTESLEPQPLDRRALDQVIHGHVYFQQEQHPTPAHSRPAHHPPAAAKIASHLPQQQLQQQQQQQQQPEHVVTAAKRPPAGGVPVMPDLSSKKHRSAADQPKETASFAAAIDEFDRATAAAHQRPVFAVPSLHPPEPVRPHPRERPTAVERHGEDGGSVTRPFGVHPGHVVPPPPTTQPWQERYGQTEVAKFAVPRPFSAAGGEIDSKGVKPWQMSHLRTLEAKGYHIVSDSEKDAVKSYAPYLVSDRSQGADRRQWSYHHPQHRVGGGGGGGGGGPSPSAVVVEPAVSATTYKRPAAINVPYAQSLKASTLYSDL